MLSCTARNLSNTHCDLVVGDSIVISARHKSAVTVCLIRGEKFLQLPYVVKGMDVSFSGILSHLEENIGSTFLEQGVRILLIVDISACV